MRINRSYTRDAEPPSDESLQRLVEESEPDVSATQRMLAIVLLLMIVMVVGAAGGGIMALLTK